MLYTDRMVALLLRSLKTAIMRFMSRMWNILMLNPVMLKVNTES